MAGSGSGEGTTHFETYPWGGSDLLVTADWADEDTGWVIAITGTDVALIDTMTYTLAKDLSKALSEAVRVVDTVRRP